MSAISVQIKGELIDQLDVKAKELDIATDELIEKVLNDYIYLEKMERIRKRLAPRFKSMGIESEEDVFKIVS